MKLSQAAKILKGTLKGCDANFEQVSVDSRCLPKGAIFFALHGANFDGHDFVNDAMQAGAIGAVISQDLDTDLPVIKVTDVHQALIDLAAYHRGQMPAKVVAVTGSCGKTTTRAMLESVFSQFDKTLASEKSFNNDIGVPLTLLRLKPEHQFVICELGANHPGEIAKLTHLVKPDIAIITNAGAAHLEGFGSLNGVACAKGEIFQGLGQEGTAIINNDDNFSTFWKNLAGKHRKLTFGIQNSADVQGRDIQLNEHGQPIFTLVYGDQAVTLQLGMIGEHNVRNALAAAAAGIAAGIPMSSIKTGLESCQSVNKRLTIRSGISGAVIIDDSYNANPLSVVSAMHTLKNQQGDSILVLGDMLELGENAHKMHHDLGKTALQLGIDQLFCYGNLTRNTAEAFGRNAHFFESQDELIRVLKPILRKDMNVLIKGSLAMNMSRIVDALMEN